MAAANAGGSRSPTSEEFNNFLVYVKTVKDRFEDNEEKYHEFLVIMYDFLSKSIDTAGVIMMLRELFKDHNDLILGLNDFMLNEVNEHHSKPSYEKKRKATWEEATSFVNKVKTRFQDEDGVYKSFLNMLYMYNSQKNPRQDVFQGQRIDVDWVAKRAKELFRGHDDLIQEFNIFFEGNMTELPEEKKPDTYDRALNFVMKVKDRFNAEDQIYKSFLEAINTFRMEKSFIALDKAVMTVKELFRGHSDLIREFNTFLPEGYVIKPKYDDVTSFANKLKNRLQADDDRIYKLLFDILTIYRKENLPTEVANIFQNNHDLLEEFAQLMPNASAPSGINL